MSDDRLPTRLVELKCGIAYDDDVEKAKTILLDLANSDDRVKPEPAPIVFVSTLGDSSVEVSLRAWVATGNYWATLRDFNEKSKTALEAAGLTIPFPQLDVHFDSQPERLRTAS